ncbi:MAG: TIR domain-containing protein [Thermomicrobiales bacterium]
MSLTGISPFGAPLIPPPKRKAFVSYHHDNDQSWYALVSQWYGDALDMFTNRSLDEPVDSNHLDYVHRVIRESNITGTSITIVLCGSETWKRKCVDWEIGSTINKGHALLGVGLASAAHLPQGILVPDRYYANWLSGYAAWRYLLPSAGDLASAIEEAIWRARNYAPDNSMPFMTRNRP